jgi:hypothetical protein
MHYWELRRGMQSKSLDLTVDQLPLLQQHVFALPYKAI